MMTYFAKSNHLWCYHTDFSANVLCKNVGEHKHSPGSEIPIPKRRRVLLCSTNHLQHKRANFRHTRADTDEMCARTIVECSLICAPGAGNMTWRRRRTRGRVYDFDRWWWPESMHVCPMYVRNKGAAVSPFGQAIGLHTEIQLSQRASKRFSQNYARRAAAQYAIN